MLVNDDYDMIFIHLDEVDMAGGTDGFSVNSPKYISTVE